MGHSAFALGLESSKNRENLAVDDDDISADEKFAQTSSSFFFGEASDEECDETDLEHCRTPTKFLIDSSETPTSAAVIREQAPWLEDGRASASSCRQNKANEETTLTGG